MITETFNYITFKLGHELFAINVAQVREVLELSQITKVPTAPAYMRGVVNVRGKATPVVDLRLKFGLPPVPDTVHSRIVVLELDLGGVQRTSRLRLEGLRPPFLKRFQLEASGDRQRWTELVRAGTINREVAMAHCFRPDELLRYL